MRSTAHKVFGGSHNLYIVLQLTHSGRFSKPQGKPAPMVFCYNPHLDRDRQEIRELTDEQLKPIQEAFIEAGTLAEKAGFDSVDIKASHGYLLHEFLSSFTKENSRYGGPSFENRTRFIREVIRGIQTGTSSLDISSRISLYDGVPHPYGFGVGQDGSMDMDLDEPVKLVRQLVQSGCCLINGTMGIPFINAHPDAPKELMQYGKIKKKKTCSSCSKCTELMRNMLVTGCPVHDKEVYKPIYKKIKH